MTIRVYNTATGRKEELVTREPGAVSIYVCGITPYNLAHIGNTRPPLVWDVIRRYLIYRGYRVTLVQNITDVDDKIISKANESGRPALEISTHFAKEYAADLASLAVAPPDVSPRVSEHIPEIVEMVKGLIERGHAYVVDGDVYYSVDSFPGYGKLSGRSLEEMQAGARIEVDERKHNPMDFALWKAAKPGEPSWESPWGHGRPGWHIECSAMSLRYLGPGFDMHGGGEDLIFPHHENEIAQSEGYTGKPFVRYWLHNAFLVLGREKMSKSLGNILTVRELLKRYPAKVLRFFMVSAHYRSPLNLGAEELEAAGRGLERLETALNGLDEVLKRGTDPSAAGAPVLPEALLEETRQRFISAMDDDFNTPASLAALYDLIRETNRAINEKEFRRTAENIGLLSKAAGLLRELGHVLGTFDFAETVDDELAAYVEEQIRLRQEARANRDWAAADRIRDDLRARGVVLEDTPQGVRWKKE